MAGCVAEQLQLPPYDFAPPPDPVAARTFPVLKLPDLIFGYQRSHFRPFFNIFCLFGHYVQCASSKAPTVVVYVRDGTSDD